jgi:hypothetical protein
MDAAGTGRDAQDEEPEPQRLGGRPTPQKKSLDQFLVEFDERLRTAPTEPATNAGTALEQRAAGMRRSPVESAAERPLVRIRPRRAADLERRPDTGPAQPPADPPLASDVAAAMPTPRESEPVPTPPGIAAAPPAAAAAESPAMDSAAKHRHRRHKRRRRGR